MSPRPVLFVLALALAILPLAGCETGSSEPAKDAEPSADIDATTASDDADATASDDVAPDTAAAVAADAEADTPADPCPPTACGDGVCDPACGEDQPGDALCAADCCVCGDGRCDRAEWCGEDGATCAEDCCLPKKDRCGDGICDFACNEHIGGEAAYCFEDCCVCGDSVCDNGLDGTAFCGESEATCPGDCCRCGDGLCVGTGACGESFVVKVEPGTGIISWEGTCPNDCTSCGDDVCAGSETFGACLVDCCGACGDGICRGGECGEDVVGHTYHCPADCAGQACGDGACLAGESPQICPQDCPPGACGNHVCEPSEGQGEATPCPADCAATCGDGTCELGEDFVSCPLDCGVCGDGFHSLALGETIANCPQDACDDHDPCTADGSELTASGPACTHEPSEGACSDGDACTVDDACADGTCVPGTVSTCDDGDPCTTDACNPTDGACLHDAKCDDGDPCTLDGCEPATGECSASLPPEASPGCPATWLPDGLVLLGPCDPLMGTSCELGLEDGSEILENLQRIYRGASVYHATVFATSAGLPQSNRFPQDQSETPVEGNCCPTDTPGSIDDNGNGLCDYDPAIWSTDTWGALGFVIGDNFCADAPDPPACEDAGEHLWRYAFDSSGVAEDATFLVHARAATPTCEPLGCNDQHVWLQPTKHPNMAFASEELPAALAGAGEELWRCVSGCHLAAPPFVSFSLATSCGADPVVLEGEIALTPEQQAGFVTAASLGEAYPKVAEALDNLEAITAGAVTAFLATAPPACQFPQDQGITPVEGNCCAWSGGTIDEDGDQRCDANLGAWSTETWTAIGFDIPTQHYFTYAFDGEGQNASAQAIATANADLDCDGMFSTFQRFVFAAPGDYSGSCAPGGQAPEVSPYLHVEMLTE